MKFVDCSIKKVDTLKKGVPFKIVYNLLDNGHYRPRNSNVLNISHPKVLVFLTCLCVGLSHLRKYELKQSFLYTPNHICICSFDIEALSHFFFTAQDLLMKDKTCLKFKASSPKFSEKLLFVLHQ